MESTQPMEWTGRKENRLWISGWTVQRPDRGAHIYLRDGQSCGLSSAVDGNTAAYSILDIDHLALSAIT